MVVSVRGPRWGSAAELGEVVPPWEGSGSGGSTERAGAILDRRMCGRRAVDTKCMREDTAVTTGILCLPGLACPLLFARRLSFSAPPHMLSHAAGCCRGSVSPWCSQAAVI